MQTIGIRELKAQLSRVLRDVQEGETVLVTDRGRVVAELRRPEGELRLATSSERKLARMAADGQLRLRETASYSYRASPLAGASVRAIDLLNEEREERLP